MKETIKKTLNNLLGNIPKLFEANELAYLTLQQKNERQIRDKVAWKLQAELDARFSDENGPQLIVRCEWPSNVDSKKLEKGQLSGRSAVDLAVLLMNEDKTDYKEVLALVEFKAHSFLNKEEWIYEHFVKDVDKMKKMTQLSRLEQPDDKRMQNAEMYFVLILSSHNKRGCEKYSSAVVYKDLLDKGIARKECRFRATLYLPTNPEEYLINRESFARGFMELPSPEWLGGKKLPLKSIQCYPSKPIKLTDVMSAGQSFEYEVFVSSIIWGPYNYNEIEIK